MVNSGGIKMFTQLKMAKFSDQISKIKPYQKLLSVHNTNPEPLLRKEIEDIVGRSFSEMLGEVDLGFTPDAGTETLRNVIAKKLYKTLKYNDIVTHAGAQEALFCIYHALLKAGDEVLLVAPIFEPLAQIPIDIGCIINYVHLEPDNWSLNLDDVERHFIQGCRLFVINFPHNPTGAMISTIKLKKIVNLCKKYDVWLLSDEVFKGLEHYQEIKLPAVADIYSKGISVGVASKAYAIPGIRVGWLACKNKQLLKKIVQIKGYLSICNSQIDECLLSHIFNKHDDILKRNLKIILKNKQQLHKLTHINQLKVMSTIPNAGCCFFALFAQSATIDVTKFVTEVVKESGYVFYPSDLFLTQLSGIRIGFGNNNFMKYVKTIHRGKNETINNR